MFWQEIDMMGRVDGEKEHETLQTDILRFLAIIGFCLMAVFALVQAIPVTGMKGETVIEKIEHHQGEQVQALEALRAENRRHKRLLSSREKEIRTLKEAKRDLEMAIREVVEEAEDLRRETVAARPVQPPRAEKKGFYVAFKSDRVFLDLLGSNSIALFINVRGMKTGFQVSVEGNSIDFVSGGRGPGVDLWEVKENMVPAKIRHAFASWTTLSSREKIWTVGLTPGISGQIKKKNFSDGRYIIEENGLVSYKP